MLEQNSLFSAFATIDDMLEKAEDKLTMHYSEMKNDLKKIARRSESRKRSNTTMSFMHKMQKRSIKESRLSMWREQ